MFNNKIRVGILGCANIAIRSLAPAFQHHPNFHLVTFAGRDFNKTRDAATSFGCQPSESYEELITRNDIDLVYIPLPNSLHFEWVMKALKSKKHVMCEKSLGCTYEEVNAMVLEAQKNSLLLVENFQFRFHSQHSFVKKILNDGLIGDVRCFRSSFGFPPFADSENIRYKSSLGGGALLDAGAYTLKAVDFMLGEDFEVISSNLNFCKDKQVDLHGGIYMQNKIGITAQLSFGFDNFYQCNYEIWGSKGKIISTRAFTAHPNIKPLVRIETSEGIELKQLPADDHFQNILTYISNCIYQGDFYSEYEQNLRQARHISKTIKVANIISL